MYSNMWRSIAYIIILAIIVLSLIPEPQKVNPFSVSDKLLHTLAYAVSMFWFGLCHKREKLFLIGSVLIILGVTLEFVQGQTGYRTMSFYDIIANSLGVIIGLLLSFSRLSKLLGYIEHHFFSRG